MSLHRTSHFLWHLLPLIMIVMARPAAACPGPAPPLRFPEGTDAAFKLRSASVFAAQNDELAACPEVTWVSAIGA